MRRMLKYIYHHVICGILLAMSVGRMLRTRSRHRRLIIMYHGVRRGGVRINGRHVQAAEFERQLIYFRKHFNVVSLKEILQMEKPAKHTIALTFDDGFTNNLTVALPLLTKHGLPSTFFVCTAPLAERDYRHPTDMLDVIRVQRPHDALTFSAETYAVSGHDLVASSGQSAYKKLIGQTYERWLDAMEEIKRTFFSIRSDDSRELLDLLDESGIRQLSASGLAAVGSHSHHHVDMTTLTEAQILHQCITSKQALDQITTEVDTIAFPYGAFNKIAIDTAKRAGYQYQFAGGDVPKECEGLIHSRIGILDGQGFPYAMLMINKGFDRFGF